MTKQTRNKIKLDALDALPSLLATSQAVGRQFTYADSLKVGGKARNKAFKVFAGLVDEERRLTVIVQKSLNLD